MDSKWNKIPSQQKNWKPSTSQSMQNSSYNNNGDIFTNQQLSTSSSSTNFEPTFRHQTPLPLPFLRYSGPYTPHQTQDQVSRPFGSMNHRLPLQTFPKSFNSNSYGQSQCSQNRFSMPTSQNPMSTTFYSNQSPSIPKPSSSMTSEMFSHSPMGTFQTDSTTPRYGLTNSSVFLPPGFMASEGIDYRHDPLHQTGSKSAFHPYQPSHAWETSGMFTQSHIYDSMPTSAVTSPPINYNYQPSRNEGTDSINSFDITKSLPIRSELITEPQKSINVQENQQRGVNLEKDQTHNNKVQLVSIIEEKYDFSCVICQDHKKDTVLLPCRHLCVCQMCSKSIDLCPLCRDNVDNCLTVYT